MVGDPTEKESEGSSSLPHKGECGNSAAAPPKMVPGIRTASPLPAPLRPQAGMAAARPTDAAQVRTSLLGPQLPSLHPNPKAWGAGNLLTSCSPGPWRPGR